jgi:hypothetical protein
MIIVITLLLCCTITIDGYHFNGGTIGWAPVDPYDNSSTVEITIMQSYSWTYSRVVCTTDVPITTPRYSSQNTNLICISDCSTDGNYSANPVNILTDCVSVSIPLNMMSSERYVNITLGAGAHFYLSYMGSAWLALNDPAVNGLQWSITSFIDLRMRPDGFINTPPAASVVSPQYAIVNRTTQIQIPVSDANAGDDVRCRWSTYTPGVNRRRRASKYKDMDDESVSYMYSTMATNEKVTGIRKKRGPGGKGGGPKGPPANPCTSCFPSVCSYNCPCSCSYCSGTSCTGLQCGSWFGCPQTTTVAGATTPTTTVETPGTLASTISYAVQQAIDECGGICYPDSVPNGTTLSNCTLSFTGLIPNTWYAVALQVSRNTVLS